jgi:ribosome-associated protein
MRFKRAERWRDRLVLEGQAAIAEFIAEVPQADRAMLSRLVEATTAEHARGKPAGAKRELFRWVRDMLGGRSQ